MFSILDNPSHIFNQYNEYLQLSKYYLNAKSTSVPIRYFNIDIDNSIYDEQTLTTFDQFKNNLTGIKYNIYEFTPAFYTSPMVFSTMYEIDKDGSRFSTTASISIFTIPKVYIGDLVQFYNPNSQKKTFYRVVNFRVPLNTFDSLSIYEVDLEPAPIDTKFDDNKNLYATLNINTRYIYDYSKEKYILYDEFMKEYYIYNFLNNECAAFLNSKLNSKELIEIYNETTGENEVYYEINSWLYNKINDYNLKFKQLTNIKLPFGYKFSLPKTLNNSALIDYNTLNTNGGILHKYDSITNNYIALNFEQVGIDFSNIDDKINTNALNLENYTKDIEKIIVILYLIDKLIGF